MSLTVYATKASSVKTGYIQGGPKKLAPFSLYSLTLSNINRFSQLFHSKNQEKICYNTVRSHHTSSVSLHYLVKCEFIKATTENKTTSVTTHFKKLTTGNNVFIVLVIV